MKDRDQDLFDVDAHLERVHACERDWNGFRLATATPRDARYPMIYPRDTAVIVRALCGLHALGRLRDDHLADALRGGADFLVTAQRDDGTWCQRYDLHARDRSIYPQEDNTAHALTVIARHVLHDRARGEVSAIEAACFRALENGFHGAARWRDEDLGLYRSTTSVHESRLEKGFTLWVNGAFACAFEKAADAADAAGRRDLARAWREERARLLHAIRTHLVRNGRYVRRLTMEREPDPRPDVTLLSPWFFGFSELEPDAEAAGVEFMEEHLVDPDLHLLARYPEDPNDMGVHMHGGQGPYLSFSSWWTQRAAERGHVETAHERLERIAGYAARGGDLPEHVATRDRFEAFMRDEFLTGLDFRKEFDEEVLLDGVTWPEILQEAGLMTSAYKIAAEDARDAGDGVIRLAHPHAWTHADFAYALALVDARA